VSVGYSVESYQWVEAGKTANIQGKEYQGPLKVVTQWRLHELSLCPIGADGAAKVRAASNPNPEKERVMDPRLRAYLEARGLAEDATEDEAWAYLAELREKDGQRGHHREPSQDEPSPQDDDHEDEGVTPPAPAEPEDEPENQTAEEVAAAERKRAAEILAMGRAAGLDDQTIMDIISSQRTIDQAGRYILEQMAGRAGIIGGAGYRGPIRVVADERDKFRAAARDAVLVRAGIPVSEPAPGHDELMNLSLRELARDCLRRAGVRHIGDLRSMVGRAFTSSDLPHILGDIANKSVMAGWESTPETWQIWCNKGSVPDFKPNRAVRLSEFEDLDEMPDGAELRYGAFADAMETYQIATYAKGFRIGRQAIINDDLNVLTSIPYAMGEAAARTVGDVAWAALTANAAMGDGKPLFHTAHANLVDITALDIEGIGKAIQLMTAQKDIQGKRRLRIQPVYFLAPTALLVEAEKFFQSPLIGTQAEPNIKNIFTGTFRPENRIYEPRLDDVSTSQFYLAGPKGRTVTVFFLNGNDRPLVEMDQEWNTKGARWSVLIDAGAKAMDWRPLVRATITG